MLVSTWYRDHHLTRVIKKGADTGTWLVDDSGEAMRWNDAVLAVDKLFMGPPPERVTCSKCGEFELASWSSDLWAELANRQLCFTCNFWYEWKKEFNHLINTGYPHTMFVVCGVAYTVCNEHVSGTRGFGGSKFTIVWPDGTEVTTTNLWCQGTIPEHLRGELPDTARFKED